MTNEKMTYFIDNMRSAFFVGSLVTNKTIYVNKHASELFGVTAETCDFEKIFATSSTRLRDVIEDQVNEVSQTLIYNCTVNKADGSTMLVDIQLGFFDEQKTEIFLEMISQKDVSKKMAMFQVDKSNKAEAILDFDDNLTIFYTNEHFTELFDIKSGENFDKYDNQFLNVFIKCQRQDLIEEIKKGLSENENYYTEQQVVTVTGETKWISLDLQKRKFDDSGNFKIMVKLINIETQMELEAENTLMQQLLQEMQELTDDILYHIDIKKGLLYHNVDLFRLDDLGQVIPDYVNHFVKREVVHPDDAQRYVNFLKGWYDETGTAETCTIRASVTKREYQQYNIRGKKIYDANGTLTNVLGALVNVQKEHDLREDFTSLNNHFQAMQEITNDILFRIDVKNGTMHQTGDTITARALGEIVPDYVNTLINNGIIHTEDIEHYIQFNKDILVGKQEECEIRVTTSPHEFEWFNIVVKPVYNENGEIYELFGKMTNIQEMKNLEVKASHDLMTNVLNKVSFEEEVAKILRTSLPGQKHALIFVDLDDFKGINDTLGHVFGDSLLTSVGKRLKRVVREDDLVGRVGGDEFVVFLNSVDSEKLAVLRTDLLLDSLHRVFSFNGQEKVIEASLGIALYPQHGKSYTELIEKADIALYSSKDSGKNIATIYSEDLK